MSFTSVQISDTLSSSARPIRKCSIQYRDNKRLSAGVIIVHSDPGSPTPDAISPRRCASRLVPTTWSSACAACPPPRRYRNSTRWLTNTRSGFVQLYLTPGGTPFLRSQTQQQQFVNSGRHHCVEPPLSPCARVHLCGRGLTDVGEGNAVSTNAQPLRKHEAKREDPKSNMTARAEQRFPNAILCSAMTLSPRSAKPYSNQWKLDYWIGVVVQRVEDQRSEPPWHIQYPFGTRQQSHDCGMTSSRA